MAKKGTPDNKKLNSASKVDMVTILFDLLYDTDKSQDASNCTLPMLNEEALRMKIDGYRFYSKETYVPPSKRIWDERMDILQGVVEKFEKEGILGQLSFELEFKKSGQALGTEFPESESYILKAYEEFGKGNILEGTELLKLAFLKTSQETDLGTAKSRKSDLFAYEIGEVLEQVRADGHKSQRAIARQFNELNIKSFYGGEWSQTTVKNVIHRRRSLGLE